MKSILEREAFSALHCHEHMLGPFMDMHSPCALCSVCVFFLHLSLKVPVARKLFPSSKNGYFCFSMSFSQGVHVSIVSL